MRIANKLELNTTMKDILDKLILDCNAKGLKYFSKGYKDTNGYLSVQCPIIKMVKKIILQLSLDNQMDYFIALAVMKHIIY